MDDEGPVLIDEKGEWKGDEYDNNLELLLLVRVVVLVGVVVAWWWLVKSAREEDEAAGAARFPSTTTALPRSFGRTHFTPHTTTTHTATPTGRSMPRP